MFSRQGNLCVISIVALLCVEIVLVVFIFGSWPVVRMTTESGSHGLIREYHMNISVVGPGPHSGTMERIVAQRNSLSRQLNLLKQKLGQAECQVMGLSFFVITSLLRKLLLMILLIIDNMISKFYDDDDNDDDK